MTFTGDADLTYENGSSIPPVLAALHQNGDSLDADATITSDESNSAGKCCDMQLFATGVLYTWPATDMWTDISKKKFSHAFQNDVTTNLNLGLTGQYAFQLKVNLKLNLSFLT